MCKVIYISGKMRGEENYNAKNFFYWQKVLEDMGYEVINPMNIDCAKALYSEWHFTEDKFEELIAMDLQLISSRADAVFALEGWSNSEGACREVRHAKEIVGIPVFYELEFEDLNPMSVALNEVLTECNV